MRSSTKLAPGDATNPQTHSAPAALWHMMPLCVDRVWVSVAAAIKQQSYCSKVIRPKGVDSDACAGPLNLSSASTFCLQVRALAPQTTWASLHQNRLTRFQNITFTSFVTDGQTDERTDRLRTLGLRVPVWSDGAMKFDDTSYGEP